MGDKGDFLSFAFNIRFSNSQVKHHSFLTPGIDNNYEDLYTVTNAAKNMNQKQVKSKIKIMSLAYILWNGVPEESKQSEEE